jgi:hypothetical protein
MIYVGQNAFRLNVDTGIDLSGASSSNVYIKYISPSLTTGSFLPVISTGSTGYMYYDFTSTQSLEKGVWTFWAYVICTDSRISIGDPFQMTVKNEGSL